MLKRVSYRWETLMLQRPWPQFLPRGKGGALEVGGKRREAFFTFTFSFYSHSSNLPPHPFSWPTFPPSAAPLQAAPSSSSSSSGMCAGVLLTQHSPHRGRITTRQSTCPSMRCRCRVAALCEPRVSVKARHEHSAAFALICRASPDCGHSTVKTLWHLLIMYTCKHFHLLWIQHNCRCYPPKT